MLLSFSASISLLLLFRLAVVAREVEIWWQIEEGHDFQQRGALHFGA